MMFREMTRQRDPKPGTYIGEFATPGMGAILKSAGWILSFSTGNTVGFPLRARPRKRRITSRAPVMWERRGAIRR